MSRYQENHPAAMAMHNKELAATRHLDFHPLRIAKRMGLPLAGRTLVFDDEGARYAFLDFFFNKHRQMGVAQAYQNVA